MSQDTRENIRWLEMPPICFSFKSLQFGKGLRIWSSVQNGVKMLIIMFFGG